MGWSLGRICPCHHSQQGQNERGTLRGDTGCPADVPVSRRTQAVRIQDGRYRHPSCYACADCGLNLKMRGHFWVGDELYCEKHARLRYQGGPSTPAVSQHS